MNIQEMSGNTILMLTANQLREFAESLIIEASSKLTRHEEPTYTPAEFAARHRVDKSTLWRWCQQGKLKPTKVGRKVVYKDSDLVVEG